MKKTEPQTSPTGEYKNRFNVRSVITTLLMILLITIVVLWNPIEFRAQRPASQAPNPQSLTNANSQTIATTLPTDITEYREQTNGIVLGSVIMVIIVIGGTLSVIQRKS
ncbi:MAG: hypothetical protein LWX83_09830 [Anaerolineae bacterium]|nr:hypothetical protein [Anaerolineae bacterium]